ncbi:choice-of-anchor A family protein [Paraglaciecola sp. 2405UD69-4]|uniref:choice-of-anchor A family protein n=1 Tax=Paraglaciecola sp. 2405UD69-4 TaxID=3391836 RepID=UPI0039C9A98E
MKRNILLATLTLMGLLSSQVHATNINVGTYNLILKDDLSTSSDIEGRLLVGGNINMSGKSLDVGSHLATDSSVDAVVVVGDITANDVKAQTGNIVYGGSAGSTNLITNSATGIVEQKDQAVLQAEFDNIWNSVEADSAYFASLEANANFDSSGMNQKYLEASSATELTVYNVSTDEILSGDVYFSESPSVPVVINVDITGLTELTLNSKAQFTNETDRTMVLWNFFSTDQTVTDISFNGDGWRGSVLAPYANISSSTGALEGGVAALSYSGSVELHNDLYSYTPPTSTTTPATEVPAPAGLALMGLGLLFITRRKLKK